MEDNEPKTALDVRSKRSLTVSNKLNRIHGTLDDLASEGIEADYLSRVRSHKLTTDMILDAVVRVANGESVASVAKEFGVSRSLFNELSRRNEEFADIWDRAQLAHAQSRIDMGYSILAGGEGSTGNVRRDVELAAYALRSAKMMNPQHFAEHVNIDTRQYVINIDHAQGDEY